MGTIIFAKMECDSISDYYPNFRYENDKLPPDFLGNKYGKAVIHRVIPVYYNQCLCCGAIKNKSKCDYCGS